MPGTYLGFPFDEEIFDLKWKAQADPVSTAFVESGAMIEDAGIAALIQNGSDTYTVPSYGVLGGAPANYDGKTDIPVETISGASESGIVYGRTQGWSEDQFVRDYNSGADPMAAIVSQVARFWMKNRQATMLGILGAVVQDAKMKSHNVSIAEPISETTVSDVATGAFGDHASGLALAVMHSKVANKLAKLQLLEYRKYTDPMGIERQLPIADINGLTVVVFDGVPTTAATSGSSATPATYTTYLLANGALRHASANVEVPVEVSRDPRTAGGKNFLYTRVRETIHPAGFSFTKPKTGYNGSPTDAQLFDKANWGLVADPKVTGICALTTQA
jgi:hypothetical protein